MFTGEKPDKDKTQENGEDAEIDIKYNIKREKNKDDEHF